jgi:phage major head subunit gpT-like protein
MEITRGNLRTLGIGFKTTFQNALKQAAPMYPQIATIVPSTTAAEEYGWLGDLPNIREWLGDRVVNNLTRFSYTIKNRDWEGTLGVDRNAIQDDNLGIYAPKLEQLGKSAAAHPDLLIWPLLNAGFADTCYDGQFFFDTDHPVLDVNGVSQSVANTDGGSGTPWFLTAKNQALNPLILQMRQNYNFVSKDAPNDDGVFFQKQFVYGCDARYNGGFGLWQFSWGSKQTLDAAHYATARAALLGMKGDNGRPLGITEVKLVYPPSLESSARQVIGAERNADGSSNIWYQTADLLQVPWLA